MDKTLEQWRRRTQTSTPSVRTPRPPRWFGNLIVGTGWARFVGRTGQVEAHAHATALFARAISGRLDVWDQQAGWRAVAGVLIPPGVRYAIGQERPFVDLLFIAARSAAGRAVAEATRGAVRILTPKELKALSPPMGAIEADEVLSKINLTGSKTSFSFAHVRDATVMAVFKEIVRSANAALALQKICDLHNVSIAELGRKVRSQTGLSVTELCAWIRLGRAVTAFSESASIQSMTAASGYSMKAFDRTFRYRFGTTPSRMLAR